MTAAITKPAPQIVNLTPDVLRRALSVEQYRVKDECDGGRLANALAKGFDLLTSGHPTVYADGHILFYSEDTTGRIYEVRPTGRDMDGGAQGVCVDTETGASCESHQSRRACRHIGALRLADAALGILARPNAFNEDRPAATRKPADFAAKREPNYGMTFHVRCDDCGRIPLAGRCGCGPIVRPFVVTRDETITLAPGRAGVTRIIETDLW